MNAILYPISQPGNSVTRSLHHYLLWQRRFVPMVLVLVGLIAMLAGTWGRRMVVINTSPSVAPGLYLRSQEPVRVGSLVDFRIPSRLQPYIHMRTGQSGKQWYILKPILAGPGDHVDTTSDYLIVNGQMIASIATHDSTGHLLPVWRENCVLQPDEYFVFSSRIPNSMDSRSFGPIRRQDIDAVRRCILTWGG